MRTTTPFFHRQKSNVKRALEKITAKVASALRLAALDAAGPGSCGVTARQSRRGDQSGERAAPGDAAGLAVAVCIAVAVVVASRAQWGRYGWRGGRSACAVGGATCCYFRRK